MAVLVDDGHCDRAMAHHAQNVQFQATVDVRGVYPREPWGKIPALDSKVVHQPEGLLSVRLSDVMILHHNMQNVR